MIITDIVDVMVNIGIFVSAEYFEFLSNIRYTIKYAGEMQIDSFIKRNT